MGKRCFGQHDTLFLMPPDQHCPVPAFQGKDQGINAVIETENDACHAPLGEPAKGDGDGIVLPAGIACFKRGKHAVRMVLLQTHAFHVMLSIQSRDQPGRTGTVPGVIAHLVQPVPVVARLLYVLIFPHGSMIPVIGKLADGKVRKILMT